MPLVLSHDHPAVAALKAEGITPSGEKSRSLRIAVLNLMPDKQATETDLLRMLSVADLMIETTWIRTETYLPRNTEPAHLEKFYHTFSEARHRDFDGMIITGAPVEHLDFEEVAYWEELRMILDWATASVRSTLFICWAAQAALYHHYGIGKVPLQEKLSGVFEHRNLNPEHPLLHGINGTFNVPQSRYTGIPDPEVGDHPELNVLARSDKGGIHLIDAPQIRGICMTGHPEYNAHTLSNEYARDKRKGIAVRIPVNYFEGNDPAKKPIFSWQQEGRLFYSNWLRHFVDVNG